MTDIRLECCEKCGMHTRTGICKISDKYTPAGGYCSAFKPIVKTASDQVNHPAHYTDGKIEVIDFIEDKKLPYHLGNVVKYVCRAGKKDPGKEVEDLRKAAWYLNRYIDWLITEEGANVE